MDRLDLSQAVKQFQIHPLSSAQVATLLSGRASLIRPLLKQSTLERLGNLSAFFPESLFAPRIWDQDEGKMSGRMLSIQTEGIFGAEYRWGDILHIPLSIPVTNKFWGLCRNSKWCYGKVEFIKHGECDIEVLEIEFYNLDLDELLSMWVLWHKIWDRLADFVLLDMARIEKRYQLIRGMVKRIEVENLLVESATQIA
jgi:hypothetical protein